MAPPPREIRADGSRDPVPLADRGPKENPVEVVERIIENSKSVGDKLAMTDTGKETRTAQSTILKDIDKLLDDQDNPPPKSGSDSSDMNDRKNKDDKDKKDMGKNGMPPPKGGMEPKGGKDPKGGDGDQQAKGGRKPRMGEKDATPKEPGKGDAKQDPGMAKAEPMTPTMPPMAPMGGAAAGAPMGKLASKPSLPIDDEVVKEVWGHLPDKLRQQVTQYYKEQFMPKYSDLLKQYYSSLANAPKKP